MRILKSALTVIFAGAATVLLAVAVRAGLEAMRFKITGNAEVLVPVVSMAVIIVSCRIIFGIWRLKPPVPPNPASGARKRVVQLTPTYARASAFRWYEIVFFVLLILGGLSAVFAFFGPEPGWWGMVSLSGFFTAAAVAEDRWNFLRAGKTRRH